MSTLLLGLLAVGGFVWYEKKKQAQAQIVSNPQTIATAAQMLAAFAATQGAQYVPTGAVGDPKNPTFVTWVAHFQVWADNGGIAGSKLRTDGVLDSATLVSLQYWYQHSQGPLASAATQP